MNCPSCGQGLSDRSLRATKIHACDECGGLWIDRSAAEALAHDVKYGASYRDWKSEPVATNRRACARCEKSPLRILRYGAAEIDVCSLCGGIWMDPGEFEKVLRRFRSGRKKSAPIPPGGGSFTQVLNRDVKSNHAESLGIQLLAEAVIQVVCAIISH